MRDSMISDRVHFPA